MAMNDRELFPECHEGFWVELADEDMPPPMPENFRPWSLERLKADQLIRWGSLNEDCGYFVLSRGLGFGQPYFPPLLHSEEQVQSAQFQWACLRWFLADED